MHMHAITNTAEIKQKQPKQRQALFGWDSRGWNCETGQSYSSHSAQHTHKRTVRMLPSKTLKKKPPKKTGRFFGTFVALTCLTSCPLQEIHEGYMSGASPWLLGTNCEHKSECVDVWMTSVKDLEDMWGCLWLYIHLSSQCPAGFL